MPIHLEVGDSRRELRVGCVVELRNLTSHSTIETTTTETMLNTVTVLYDVPQQT